MPEVPLFTRVHYSHHTPFCFLTLLTQTHTTFQSPCSSSTPWALIPSSSSIVKLAGTRNSLFEALLVQLSNSGVEDASACCIHTGRCAQCSSTSNLILTHLFFLICGFPHNFVLNEIYQTWCNNLKSHLSLQIG